MAIRYSLQSEAGYWAAEGVVESWMECSAVTASIYTGIGHAAFQSFGECVVEEGSVVLGHSSSMEVVGTAHVSDRAQTLYLEP